MPTAIFESIIHKFQFSELGNAFLALSIAYDIVVGSGGHAGATRYYVGKTPLI